MNQPAPGDIWNWTRNGDDYTVIVLEYTGYVDKWRCFCFDDGDFDNWWFRGLDMKYWRKIA
jgi:hypothetical protein